MKKAKNNRQILNAAIKNLSDMDLVILRERILSVTEQVINNKDEVTKSMQNSFIMPSLYIGACERIFEAVDFKD
jgi:F420-0:gamma-glutamyl ligase